VELIDTIEAAFDSSLGHVLFFLCDGILSSFFFFYAFSAINQIDSEIEKVLD
jgi:hypothetical protein